MAEKSSITLVWKIENFSFCVQEKGESLESPEFYSYILNNSVWQLSLYPRGNKTSNNNVEVYLYNKSKKKGDLIVDYEISFLSEDGSVLFSEVKKDEEIIPFVSCTISSYPRIDQLIPKVNEFLHRDRLTIQCRIWMSRQHSNFSLNCFARSCIKKEHRSLQWTLTEYSNLEVNQKKKCGFWPKLDKSMLRQPKFVTEVFLTDNNVNQATVQFEFKQTAKNVLKLLVKCKISVLDTNGKIMKSKEDSYRFTPTGSIWRFPQFLTKNELTRMAGCVVGDAVTFLFDLTFSTGVVYSNMESISSVPVREQNSAENTTGFGEGGGPQNVSLNKFQSQKGVKSLTVLQEDLLSLYTDRTLSDFELRTGSKSIPVHKSVLAARSPVFKAMFTSGMKEGADNFLDIPDLEGDSLHKLLVFVYTGNVEELDWSDASNLYYAADKYDIFSLKQKCCTCLTNSIEESNLCEILILADRHNDEVLKSSVHEFIMRNDKEIILSDKWKRFLVENTVLAAETLQLIYSRKLDINTK